MRIVFVLLLISLKNIAQQPNIIYIMSDDHDADGISAYNNKFISTPHIDRLAKEGMLFKNAFVGNSICGPARATLLTGQHSHKNGIKDNRTRFDSSKITLPKLMQAAGYQTAIVGKWHLHSYPTGFDYWKILPGQGLYYDPRVITMSGDTSTRKGYATDVITEEALNWLDTREKEKPFMLLLHHKAPHRNFVPKLKWIEVFSKKTFPEPTTLYADMNQHGKAWQNQKMSILKDMTMSSDLKIDPEYLLKIPGYNMDSVDVRRYDATMNRIPESDRVKMKEIYSERARIYIEIYGNDSLILKYKYQWYMQDFMACIASVDENVGKLLTYLDKNNLTNNTVVIYTSDQGFFLGENGWFDKRWMYDVSMQIPLLVRWPSKVKTGSENLSLVQNIDFAPTILDIAGQKTYNRMHGVSLRPLLTGNKKELTRKNIYYHYYEYPADHAVLPHLGVRGKQYKLIYFYTINEWELYDLKEDPDEQVNLSQSVKHKTILTQMKKILLQLRNQYDDHEPAGELK